MNNQHYRRVIGPCETITKQNHIIHLSEATNNFEKKGTVKIYPVGLNKTTIAEGILLGAAPPQPAHP